MNYDLKEGTLVSWTTDSGVKGKGMTITEVCEDGPMQGHCLVAVDASPGEERPVIYCAITWLTPMKEAA